MEIFEFKYKWKCTFKVKVLPLKYNRAQYEHMHLSVVLEICVNFETNHHFKGIFKKSGKSDYFDIIVKVCILFTTVT